MCQLCQETLDFPTAVTVEDICVRLCDECYLRWANGEFDLEVVAARKAPDPRQESIFDILGEMP